MRLAPILAALAALGSAQQREGRHSSLRRSGAGPRSLRTPAGSGELRRDIHFCNTFDPADFCTSVRVSAKGRVRVEQKACNCPGGFTCPSDPRITKFQEDCRYDASAESWRCLMVCVPDFSILYRNFP